MLQDITLEPITHQDSKFIRRIEFSAYGMRLNVDPKLLSKDSRYDKLRYKIKQHDYLKIVHNGKIIGTVLGLQFPKHYTLYYIALDLAYRHQGYGTQVLNHFLSTKSNLWIHVPEGDTDLLNWYRSRGFIVSHTVYRKWASYWKDCELQQPTSAWVLHYQGVPHVN